MNNAGRVVNTTPTRGINPQLCWFEPPGAHYYEIFILIINFKPPLMAVVIVHVELCP